MLLLSHSQLWPAERCDWFYYHEKDIMLMDCAEDIERTRGRYPEEVEGSSTTTTTTSRLVSFNAESLLH